jgi:hypothetical protein
MGRSSMHCGPYTNYVFVDRAGVRLSGLAEAVEETARQEMANTAAFEQSAVTPHRVAAFCFTRVTLTTV